MRGRGEVARVMRAANRVGQGCVADHELRRDRARWARRHGLALPEAPVVISAALAVAPTRPAPPVIDVEDT
jgi:hypothetical protein